VISAFARASLAVHVEGLLEEMHSNYLDGNDTAKRNDTAKPDIISFNTILNALSKSNSCDAPK
jgi:hypothetical protein